MSDILVLTLPSPPALSMVVQPTPPLFISVGVQGPPGPPGIGDGYNYTQLTPSTEWTIPHNLGYYPDVSIFDTGGMEVEVSILHLNLNTTIVSINIPIAGKARCS